MGIRLELLFANQDALVSLLGISRADQPRYLSASGEGQRDMAQKQQALTSLLEEQLTIIALPEIQREILAESLSVGSVVSVDQAFYFRHEPQGRVAMHAALNTDETIELSAELDEARFPFSSSNEHLSSRRHVFAVGTVSAIDPSQIRMRIAFVGWRNFVREPRGLTGGDWQDRRISPQRIDQFSQVDWSKSLTAAEVRTMGSMAESDVKDRLAQILGFPFVAKDWGGERSDMVTNNLLIDGAQTSSAWLLKGRSVSGPMRIPDLGARGDQIERLSTDSADVLVVQHGKDITAAVINMVAAFAYDMRRPRRFMIMDGQSTGMILRDYGLLQ
ncbi:hypothetical protein [Subtercola endophyticus]|uniref:hypothetical protein n=1 Tax=Subtercola endophyticus TaxID=2895559 RepID=UPI001E41698B|nr:hypothetical protein [Subtercola endophyticus]UFS57648.1 hypothetical protein LQ955_11310 [Subtercola endophyticus]